MLLLTRPQGHNLEPETSLNPRSKRYHPRSEEQKAATIMSHVKKEIVDSGCATTYPDGARKYEGKEEAKLKLNASNEYRE